MTQNRNLEVQQDCSAASRAGDAWASVAANQCLPSSRGLAADQLPAQSQRLQELGVLGNLTIATLHQRFDRIDQSGNGNGVIERQDLTSFIQRQESMPQRARDNDAIMGAQNVLHYMDVSGRQQITRSDVMAGLKDGLMPEARSMQSAANHYDGLVSTMRTINPDSITAGNQINVGLLREAVTQHPESFTKAQHHAVNAMLGDAYNVANSVDFLNRIGNWLWNGNEGRYLSPESVSTRAEDLGANTRVQQRPIYSNWNGYK